METTLFTVEEENLICIFDASRRDALIAGLAEALSDFDEPELREIAESALRKLNNMTDQEFAGLILCPAYFDDESEV